MILNSTLSVEIFMMFTGGKIKQYCYSQFMFIMFGKKKLCMKLKRIKVICGVSNDLSVPLLSVFNMAIAVTFCNFTN